jgi:hypothetical protein
VAAKQFAQSVWADAVLAWRALFRLNRYALILAGTLGLALSATFITYSISRSVALRPLPYESPEKVVLLWNQELQGPAERGLATPKDVAEWRRRLRSLSAVAAVEAWSNNQSAQIDMDVGRERGFAVLLSSRTSSKSLGFGPAWTHL